MSTPAAKPQRPSVMAAVSCLVAAALLFSFLGNASRGYVKTESLFWWWVSQWLDPAAESEHGWLILALSGWLLWRNLGNAKRRMPNGEVEGDSSALGIWNSAFVAMVGGLALHLLGFVAQQTRLSILAFLLFTWGGLRLGGGRRWGAAAAFPLAFMVFAIPINVLDSVGFWLRVWVVDASAAIARSAGIGVLRSGTQLLAPDGAYNYDVAAACSGIRSLTALAALSLLAGYLNFTSWWRRTAIFALCFPLVYLGNVARIVAIIFAAAAGGGSKWGDVAHEVMGYGVFAIVLGGVLAAVSLLRRLWPETVEPETCHVLRDKSDEGVRIAGEQAPAGEFGGHGGGGAPPSHELRPPEPEPTENTKGAAARLPRVPWAKRPAAVAAVVVGLAAAEMAFLWHLQRSPIRGQAGVAVAADGVNPVELPAFLGTEWIGRRSEVTAVEREILPSDTGYSRKLYVAVADPRKQVFLSIVLSGRDRTSIHRPELCLVGQGWTIVDQGEHRFAARGAHGATVPATLLRVRREVQTPRGKAVVPQLVAYWFSDGDGAVASHGERFWRDARNRVLRGRADRWAYVLFQTDAADGEAAALARMQAVLDETLPVFARRP